MTVTPTGAHGGVVSSGPASVEQPAITTTTTTADAASAVDTPDHAPTIPPGAEVAGQSQTSLETAGGSEPAATSTTAPVVTTAREPGSEWAGLDLLEAEVLGRTSTSSNGAGGASTQQGEGGAVQGGPHTPGPFSPPPPVSHPQLPPPAMQSQSLPTPAAQYAVPGAAHPYGAPVEGVCSCGALRVQCASRYMVLCNPLGLGAGVHMCVYFRIFCVPCPCGLARVAAACDATIAASTGRTVHGSRRGESLWGASGRCACVCLRMSVFVSAFGFVVVLSIGTCALEELSAWLSIWVCSYPLD